MSDEQLKEIIIALINNEYFMKYNDPDNEAELIAKDIAKFVDTFYKEMVK